LLPIRATLVSGSGNLQFEELQAGEIKTHSNSGNITGHRFQSNLISFNSGSGNVTLEDSEAEISGETDSGNIKVIQDALTKDTNVKAGSGDVTVEVNGQSENLAFDFATDSGSSKVNWPYRTIETGAKHEGNLSGTFGDGKMKLEVATKSGNIKLGQR
jgi:lia operon protein LiaG